MQVFTIDVDYSTHDALKSGVTALGFRRFILADTDAINAQLVAAQWVAASGFMPTRTTVCI